MAPIHVLHVSHAVNTGLAHCVADYVAYQVDHGLKVSVASPSGRLADLATAHGARAVDWPARRTPGLGSLAELRRLRAIVRELRPDIVHLHCAKAGLAGRLVLRGRTPTFFSPHAWSFFAVDGVMRSLVLGWERFAARWTDAVVCVSLAESDSGAAAGIQARTVVLPNALPPATLADADRLITSDRTEVRASLGVPDDRPLAVCTARLVRQKGQDVLVAAWPGVRDKLPDATVVLVGDGPDRAALAAAAGDGVRFAGSVDRLTALRWMYAADVVVCPSRWEGMSLVPLEAMALGRPLVVTDVDGMAEGVHPDAVRMVLVDDVAGLTDAVISLLADPDTAAGAGAVGRAHARDQAGRIQSRERLPLVYREVLAARWPSAVARA